MVSGNSRVAEGRGTGTAASSGGTAPAAPYNYPLVTNLLDTSSGVWRGLGMRLDLVGRQCLLRRNFLGGL